MCYQRFPWKNLTYMGGAGVLGALAAKLNEDYFHTVKVSQVNCSSSADETKGKSCSLVLYSTPTPIGNATHASEQQSKLKEAIARSRVLCEQVCKEYGLPGLAVGVTVNGKLMWEQGFGYSDIENSVPMQPRMIMRIASISKSMTTAMLGKLLDEGKIDLDLPIQTYLPNFPKKCVDGKPVEITTRHLVSHLSGIRHYLKKGEKEKTEEREMLLLEYFIKDHYDSVEKSLQLFVNDELFHEPGSKYLYTTHGYTVVAAIIEKIVGKRFDDYSRIMFNIWGLKNTFLDIHEPIIYNRVRYYSRNKEGVLKNSPYVDNSYKWAGGGFLSNTTDLLQFAHILLYSLQCTDNASKPFLSKETIKKLWTGDVRARWLFLGTPTENLYGMGFVIAEPFRKCVFCKEQDLVTVHHTGAAIGTSSILLLKFPNKLEQCKTNEKSDCDIKGESPTVQGVVIAMMTNLTDVSLSKTANEIASLFQFFL